MKDDFKLPCIEKNGKYVTINECNVCNRKNHCDSYITILEESHNKENDDE